MVSRATGLLQYVEHHIEELLQSADSEGLKRVEEKEKQKEIERKRERERERGRAFESGFRILERVEESDEVSTENASYDRKGDHSNAMNEDEQEKEKEGKGEKGSGDVGHISSEENLSEESESRVQEGIYPVDRFKSTI